MMDKLTDRTYDKNGAMAWRCPNPWDAAALCLVIAVIVLLAWGATDMATPYRIGQTLTIDLGPEHLPYYALRSVLRMLIALVVSLLFTFVVGTLAAKNKHAERFIIPLIDILQSVPVLGYLSVTVVVFIAWFPNSLFGPECAAIFAIFTSQVWNITLSFYQSVITVPNELHEAVNMFRLSAWQRFWRVEVPYAMPGLLWNVMMSMSASWFFVVASEAITVSKQSILLPGIGSYIARSVSSAHLVNVGYAMFAMFVVILIYDQLLFRPLSQWVEKFKFEYTMGEEESNAWVVTLFQRTRWLKRSVHLIKKLSSAWVNCPLFLNRSVTRVETTLPALRRGAVMLWYVILMSSILLSLLVLGRFIFKSVALTEVKTVFYLGLLTGIKVMVLIALSALIWLPIGVWIGLRPRWVHVAQPLIQFVASFPANLFFPIVVIAIVRYQLNPNIWTAPLMILGTQWYILFNVIAGASALPKDLKQAAENLNVTGWLRWKRLILPGIFPYLITGAITAAGGAWNASIIAEVVQWGQTKIEAVGLGAYITHWATKGDFPRLVLGITIMCVFVLVINYTLWRPLYNLAKERFGVN